jgi:hypothetical protein
MSEAKRTTDHKTIRRWAEARGGRPARVKGTGKRNDAGLLRFDFGDKDESLEEISWEEFFEKFEESKLALLHQDETQGGGKSRLKKIVDSKQKYRGRDLTTV